MSKAVVLQVGSAADMGKRFIDAWHRAEQGEKVSETHLTFFSFEALTAALSPKRLELLKRVHRQPAKSVSELARDPGRDYKRVHEDISELTRAGLIVRNENGIRAPYGKVQAIVSLEE